MIATKCTRCSSEFEPTDKRQKRCIPCRGNEAKPKDYWTPEAIKARRIEKEAKRAAKLAEEAAHNAQVASRALKFHDDESELAYLIKQQGIDLKHGNRIRFRKNHGAEEVFFSEFGGEDLSCEDHLDNLVRSGYALIS